MSKIKSKSKSKTPVAVETQTPEPVTFKVTSAAKNQLHTLAVTAGNAMKSSADALDTMCKSMRKITGGKPLSDETVQDLLDAMKRGCKWHGTFSIKSQRTKWKSIFESYASLPRAIGLLADNSRFASVIGDVGSAHAIFMANKLNKPKANVPKIAADTAKFFVNKAKGKGKGKGKPRTFATVAKYKQHVAIVIKALLAAKCSERGAGEVKEALRKLGGKGGIVNLGKA